MSVTTNRIALSTIKDTHLNSSTSASSSPNHTPTKTKSISFLKEKKRPTLFKNTTTNTYSLTNTTTSSLRKRRPDLITKSFSLANSATTLNKKIPVTTPYLKSVSFSDYRSTSSNSSTLKLTSTNDAFKNDSVGLAATKLKLKLQLAFYKNKQTRLKSKKYLSTTNNNNSNITSTAIKLNSVIASLESPPSSAKCSPTGTTNFFNSPSDNLTGNATKSSSSLLPTPPQQQQQPFAMNYSHSINVNLNSTPKKPNQQQQPQKVSKNTSTLSKIANKKGNKKSQKLKLFQIRKNSIYYCPNQKKLPLIQADQKYGMDITKYSFYNGQTSAPSSQGQQLPGANFSFINYPDSQPSSQPKNTTTELPSIVLNPPTAAVTTSSNNTSASSHYNYNSTALPSINKILKTPIRRTSSIRHPFSFQKSFNEAAPLVVGSQTTNNNPNDETILDEDNEMTIIQNTTINNTTIDQNATIEVKNDDDDEDESEKNRLSAKNQDILTSSPLSNDFTTPRKFSVAKSLLQLGGHRLSE
ncbi:LOW QUALITY PROTEIN: hypothetical protein SBY92_005343 [Candida maltosa Xu316]